MLIERPIQRRLDLRAADGSRLTFLRPMLGIESIKAVLDIREDEVLEMIGDALLLWAWDLKADAGAARSFVRVWSRSVTCYVNPGAQPAEPETIDELIEVLLPANSKLTRTLRATELQRLFNVSSGHVLNLLAAGSLSLAPRTACRPGRGGSPEITRASVVELLKARRLP